jgi:hypothetical protein
VSETSAEQAELSDAQVQEWREVNGELLRSLTTAVGRVTPRETAGDVGALRDRFHVAWRSNEASLHNRQQELISAAEKGDFIKAALVARELVTLRARVQASQAAFFELDLLVGQSRNTPVELSRDQIVESEFGSDEEIETARGSNLADGRVSEGDASRSNVTDKHALVTAELRRLGTPEQIGLHRVRSIGGEGAAESGVLGAGSRSAKVLRFRKVS